MELLPVKTHHRVIFCTLFLLSPFTVCGCSDVTNTVEMPANPESAPGPRPAGGSNTTAKEAAVTAPQLTP